MSRVTVSETCNRTNVLVSSYQPYTVKTIDLMSKAYAWKPKVWFVADENRHLVTEKYPSCFQYDFFDVVKGVLPEGISESDLDLPSPDELEKLAKYEYVFLYMLERNDSNYSAFTYKQRLEFYYRALGLWKTLLRKSEIDIVLFEEEPHQAVDYALYLVAKLNNIQMLMTTRTISELGILPYEDFEAGCVDLNTKYQEVVASYKQSQTQIDISDDIESYFETMNADYLSVLKEHLWDQVDEYKKLSSGSRVKLPDFGRLKNQLVSSFFAAGRFVLNSPIRSDQLQKGKALYRSQYSYREYLINKLKAVVEKKQLRKLYDSLAVHSLDSFNNDKKYIYVALQYQPEKSTCPLAGRFVDQRYLVKWLSNHLDDSWHILVKEHPSQFISSYTRFGECFRDDDYYQELAGLPNVSLMGLSLDSFMIMSKCITVACAGGTVCWEAVARGMPALNFAISWFRPCHGVFYISEEHDLLYALQKIESGFKPDLYLVKAFAQLIKNYGFNAAIGGVSSLEYKNIDEDSNAQAHFNALSQLVK